jgi:mRNA interferase RelE/StbE
MSGTGYTVEFTTAAARQVKKLPVQTRIRLGNAIKALVDDPRPPGSKKLSGRNAWRIRVGDYRVIYEIEDDKVLVTIFRVGNRRDVYGDL